MVYPIHGFRRANGWGLLSHIEVLTALAAFPGHSLFPAVQADFATSIAAMLPFQDPASGRCTATSTSLSDQFPRISLLRPTPHALGTM